MNDNFKEFNVLILIVVEDGLVQVKNYVTDYSRTWVLILIVVEDGLVLQLFLFLLMMF